MTEDNPNDEAIVSDEKTPVAAEGELAGPDASLELVEDQRRLTGSGVTLSGESARELIEAVAPMARELARAGKTIAGNRKAQEGTGQL
jgi:hypothetical protein